jgi:hypothetical protein
MRGWFVLFALVVPVWGQMPTCSAPVWSPCDLVFELQAGESGDLRAEFRSPHRDTKTLRAFREGGALVLRFTPDEVGEWDYRLTTTLRRLDAQLGKVTGTASNAPGFVRAANVHHFQTADMQPHLWMGSPIENFLRLPRAQFEELVTQRAAEKFTHIRIVIEADSDLREVAERVRVIHDRGIVTDIVLATLPEAGRERYLTEIAARFAAFNITWAGVPAFEKLRNARAVLRDAAAVLAQMDPYKHLRTSMAEVTSSPLTGDRWMGLVTYGTPDPNVGAVEHQLVALPAINAGIRSRADLWNATMNGHYPASGAGREFAVWFDVMSHTRHWEMEPYFEVSGGRAVAVREYESAGGDHYDAVEYVVYVEKAGPVELTVENHGYDVTWINPATGERTVGKDFKGKTFTGEPPEKSHDWVLHISREGHKEGLLKKYKFESRRILMQTPETATASVPFEIEAPSAEISVSAPVPFALKVSRPTRATRELLVVWTAEAATGANGGRVVGTGSQGTLQLPATFAERVPSVVSLRAAILNSNGKVYVLDRAYRLVP